MEAMEIQEIYNSRFQIEFLFRDSKEYTGLTACQARDEKSLISTLILLSRPSILLK